MEIRVNIKYLKELVALPAHIRKKAENLTFNEIPSCKDLNEVPNLQKLSGYKNYYRIRIGQYRMGLRFEGNILTFERILHKKDIYKYFP